VLRAYKPASFVEQQHKARAAALAAGGTGAGQGPLRQLRLNRLLQEVQVGGLLVWTHSAPSAALLRFALLCLPARRLPGCACADPILLRTCLPAWLFMPSHVWSRLPLLQVLRDCKHFIKLGSGERFGCGAPPAAQPSALLLLLPPLRPVLPFLPLPRYSCLALSKSGPASHKPQTAQDCLPLPLPPQAAADAAGHAAPAVPPGAG
jgi:hypothetical protein